MSRRVVVVGAGISGLATARHLVAGGDDVTVLESRSRVGGRLSSVDGLDVGASWFWPNEPRIAELVNELGVVSHPQHVNGNALFQRPEGAEQIDGNPLDVPSWRFSRGADSVAKAVARRLPAGTLRLSTAASSLRCGADEGLDVGIVTPGPPDREHSLEADHVVLALPPALAVHRIAFDPPLPRELEAVARSTPVWMGAITKVVATFADAFWRREGLSGSAISHLGPMRELHDMSGPDGLPAALFGFVPPRSVGAPTVTEDAIRNQLTTLFGSDAPRPERIIVQDWRTESDTAPPGVERLDDYGRFGHPAFQTPALDGRLHWSSTETATAFAGHIEGALVAAERVARTIMASSSTAPNPTGLSNGFAT